ncbi:hypothetical protein Q8A73_021116 [Channa argus]|nr:hypothetical protein Q8A73_021116 [Channa argus]
MPDDPAGLHRGAGNLLTMSERLTPRSVSMKHMVLTHKTTPLGSNCLDLMLLQCAAEAAAACACVRVRVRTAYFPLRRLTRASLNGESARSRISCPRDFRKHRSQT